MGVETGETFSLQNYCLYIYFNRQVEEEEEAVCSPGKKKQKFAQKEALGKRGGGKKSLQKLGASEEGKPCENCNGEYRGEGRPFKEQ